MRHSAWLAGLFLCLATVPIYGIEIGGELFVDLDASTYDASSDTWTNAGSYTDFTKVNTAEVVTVGSYPAVVFDGTTAFVGSDLAPETITFDEERTIEAWVFNPTIAGEETVVSWGRRGGPDGTNMSFNYGNNGAFGAVGHWGAPDIGWDDAGGAPEAFKWNHLAYTYDPDGVVKVYANGELANEDNIVELIGGLNTWDDTAIAVGAQWLGTATFDNVGDPAFLEPGLRGTLGIGRLRIHDEALTGEQLLANYNEEVGNFESPVLEGVPEVRDPIAAPLSAGPIHRYSFDSPAGFAEEGAEFMDSVGGAHGVVLGEDAEFTGTALRLPGGDSAVAAYGDLPNGIISGLTDVTVEAWVTTEGAQNWSRIFDFGSNSPGGDEGELEFPGDDNGGNTEGLDYFLLSATRGTNANDHRLEMRNVDPASGGDPTVEPGGITTVDATIEKELPDEAHYVAVYDSDGFVARDFAGNITGSAPALRMYYNGELVGEGETEIALADINDVNNWLGRSNWTNDSNFEGSFDEFRIYDYALNNDEVFGSHEAGPETLNILEVMVGDCNTDGMISTDDLACVVAAEGAEGLESLLATLNVLPGDVDANGEVGFLDFLALANNFGSTGVGYTGGDIDGDGAVGFLDFLALANNFGQTSDVANLAGVPEPNAGLIVSVLLGSLLCIRKRRFD